MMISLRSSKIEILILDLNFDIPEYEHKINLSQNKLKTQNMLLTPQHRRSARVAARMQKTAQQEFNERVANGTMTKEELLNAPTCFRSFDEAEDAILAQSDEESEEEDEDEDDGALIEDPVLLRLIVSKLPPALVAAIIQQLIQELGDVEREIDDANMEEEEEEEEEDSIASRLLARRLKASRGW